MGWAEELDSYKEEPKTGNPWLAEMEAPKQTEEETPLFKQVGSAAVSAYEMIDETGEAIGEISGEIVRGTAAGLYKASGDLASLISAGVETVYDSGRIIGREIYKASTDTQEAEMDDFILTDYLSKNFKEATKRDVKVLAGEDQGIIGEYTQKIAEYAGLTQAITRSFITKGKTLLKDPSKVSSGKIKSFFEKSMIQAAKNPKAAYKLEQGVSALVAVSGETAKQVGAEAGTQLITELVTGLLSGQIINTSKSVLNFIGKKIPGSAEKIGKIQAAEYLQEVAKNDPKFMEKLERGLKLQSETGIEMDLSQLTNNPELKAALQMMESHTAGSMTALESRLEEQTKKIKEIFPSKPQEKESAVRGIEDYRSEIEIKLAEQSSKAIDDVIEQIDNAAPLDKEALGESGQIALNDSKEAANAEINKLYEEVGNPNIPTVLVAKALNEARKSPLKNDNYMKELDAELVSTLESNILGRTSQKIIKAPLKDIKLSGGGAGIPKEMSLDGIRLIEGRIKERIRIARAAGEGNKARLLGKILSGIFDQYENVGGLAAHEVANLKKASAASKRMHEIFDQGDVLLQSKVDVKGMERITTEGFVRNFIKANSDTKGVRTNEAVDGFYNAYGDIPEARQWFVNAFGALLKEEIARYGGNIRPKQINLFINKHSSFLKRAGIEDRFDNVTKAIKEADNSNNELVLDKESFQKTVMSKFVGSDDPVNFIVNAAQSGSLKRLVADINKIPNKARREVVQRGVKEALWEGVKRRLTTSRTAGGEEILLDTGAVRNMLDDINYGDQLKTGLGKEHYNSLKKLIDIVDRISPDISKTAGLPAEHIDENLVEKLMTGLRAAAHGFVRPDLIAAQMSMRGYKAITTKQAHAILKEAMSNTEFAKELLKMSTSIKGKAVVRTMFSPLVSATIEDKEQ